MWGSRAVSLGSFDASASLRAVSQIASRAVMPKRRPFVGLD